MSTNLFVGVDAMPSWLPIAIVFAAFLGLCLLAFYLFDRWAKEQVRRMGWLGLIYVIFVMFVITGALVSILIGIMTFLAYVAGGAIAGALFAIPVLLGVPWYYLIPYGAGLGAVVYLVYTLRVKQCI